MLLITSHYIGSYSQILSGDPIMIILDVSNLKL